MDGEWILLPRPRRVERLGGVQERAAAGAAPAVHIDPTAGTRPEGYRLVLRPDRAEIVAHDAAGAFYAEQTLTQIRRQTGAGDIACAAIEDWPDFRHRGLMIDVSRDRVPAMDTLSLLVDLMAEWKLNELQLYTEHTFAYTNHREVWAEASPITAGDINTLGLKCHERHIELVPNQNSFGHMERWLRHPRYRPLAEAPDGFTDPWGRWRPGPFSLCPTDPGAIVFLAELYAELLPNFFESRRFNVGCDETFDLGQGRSRAACEERGKGRVYVDFLRSIALEVARHGKTMMFWGDVILNHPELIPDLPPGVIALEWGYEADHPFTTEAEHFARAGVPFYVCPGTSTWNSIAGRTANALANLTAAAAAGRTHGALGYLITDWGDNGHWQSLPVSYLGIAKGAAVAWAGEANSDVDVARALDLHAFRDRAGVMGQLAADLGNVYRQGLPLVRNASVLAELLIYPERPLGGGSFAGLTAAGLETARGAIDSAVAELPRARMESVDAALIASEFRLAAGLLGHACALGRARLEAAGRGDGDVRAIDASARRSLASELEELCGEFRRLWRARSRPGGLTDSVGRLEKLIDLYRKEGT